MNNDGKCAIYAVIRTENLAAALAAFRDQFTADPVAVIVNADADLMKQTSAALTRAGLDIPVASSGGCLLGEMWLQRPAVDVQAVAEAICPRSLTARCDRARRAAGPMSRERARQLVLEMEVER